MSTNHVFIDVTRCSREVELGDEVVLYGSQKGEHITIGEVAKWGESSVYKATIMMNPLMPRVFIELGSESK
jgi:alanine racemase